MANLTLSLPEDLKKNMGDFPEINWSVVARTAIARRVLLLKQLHEFTKDSELTEEDAIKLGRKINKSLAKKYKSKK